MTVVKKIGNGKEDCIMKKVVYILSAIIALVACAKEAPVVKESVQEESQEIKVNINITREEINDTKATIKTGWANDDVVFLFFNGVAAPKYMEMKYNSGVWTATPKNDLVASDLSGAADKHLTAIYLPYGSAYNVAADGTAFTIKNGENDYSGHFYTCVGVEYTYDSELTATITLIAAQPASAKDKLVHFDVAGYTDGHTYDLYQDYMKPISLSSISASGAVATSEGIKGDAIPGYVDAGNSILSFSGVLDVSAVNVEKDYQFSVNDVTASVLYTRDAGNKTLNANKYIGIGNISTSTWNANEYVYLGFTNFKGERVMWAKKNLGATAETGEGSYGKYYAWGDLEGYPLEGTYGSYTCSHSFTGDAQTIPTDHFMSIKEETSSVYQKTLKPEYDPAHVALKGLWRMPTGYQRAEDGKFEGELARLMNNTTNALTGDLGTVNAGITFTGSGNSIFMPFAGYVWGNAFVNFEANWYLGDYPSSTCQCEYAGGFKYNTNKYWRVFIGYNVSKGTKSIAHDIETSGAGLPIRPVFSIK